MDHVFDMHIAFLKYVYQVPQRWYGSDLVFKASHNPCAIWSVNGLGCHKVVLPKFQRQSSQVFQTKVQSC
jgi:hypothetical protein